nr:hypothetical protein [Nonomuraea antri]
MLPAQHPHLPGELGVGGAQPQQRLRLRTAGQLNPPDDRARGVLDQWGHGSGHAFLGSARARRQQGAQHVNDLGVERGCRRFGRAERTVGEERVRKRRNRAADGAVERAGHLSVRQQARPIDETADGRVLRVRPVVAGQRCAEQAADVGVAAALRGGAHGQQFSPGLQQVVQAAHQLFGRFAQTALEFADQAVVVPDPEAHLRLGQAGQAPPVA